MKKSDLQFRRLFETTQDGILILDADTGQVTGANPFLVAMLGYSLEELTGKKLWDLGASADRATSEGRLAILQQQGFVRFGDLTLLAKDGRQIPAEMVCNLFTLAGTRSIQCNVRDISARGKQETDVRRLNTLLEARAAELEAANGELEAFNYMVAHDLNQPLTLINGYCHAIKARFGDQLEAECLEYLQQANNNTMRMNHLIETLLDFSTASHGEPQREMVDLGQLACEAAEALWRADPDREADFRFARGALAYCDANLLRIVLDNLLGNAMKYSRIRDKSVIRFGEQEVGGVPAYFVSDNGIGFDPTSADKLFTPFHRLPSAGKREGFGIGLATVELIVRRHGGKVWAEGELDKGSCIYFTLAAQGAMDCRSG
jgi:PAS domain S-box-containing protein